MSTPETWDEIYSKFSEFNPLDDAFYQRLIQILTDSINDSKSILEVGSGSGFLTSFFQNQKLDSFGMDRSIMPLHVAKEKFNVKNLIQGDMFHIPYKSNSFDVVWNEGVLEHFKFPKNLEACKEMVRVSKKYVIIAVPNKYTIWPIRKTLLKIIGKWPYGYEESYSKNRLVSLMKKAGLEIVDVQGVRILPPIKERKRILDILSLGMLTLPLKKSTIKRLAKKSPSFEKNHSFLTQMFGYEILVIGKKLNTKTIN